MIDTDDRVRMVASVCVNRRTSARTCSVMTMR